MTAPLRLGYVVRFCDSLDALVAFYRDALGLFPSKRTEHWAQFDVGSVRFGLFERAAMASALGVAPDALGRPPGAMEVAFQVADCDAAYSAAVAAGARSFAPPADRPWGERTAYVLDPEGAIVELYTPLSRTGE